MTRRGFFSALCGVCAGAVALAVSTAATPSVAWGTELWQRLVMGGVTPTLRCWIVSPAAFAAIVLYLESERRFINYLKLEGDSRLALEGPYGVPIIADPANA